MADRARLVPPAATDDQLDATFAELVALLAHRGPDALDRPFADDWRAAADDPARLRVVLDQVASLTDQSAVGMHAALRRIA